MEVGATALTAIPVVREKQGIAMPPWRSNALLAGNIVLQVSGSLVSHLVAPWFGPVSIVVPFFYSATLLSNVFIFGVIMREEFTKNMRVGTYVIVVAVILLPELGPTVQARQDIGILMRHWYSSLWFCLILLASFSTATLLAVKDIRQLPMKTRTAILLIARAASISVNLTVSRSFILGPSESVLILFVIIKIVTGVIYTYAIVVQSTNVEQARFVPLNAISIIAANAVTGIFIWEDFKVVQSWYGYACVFVLLGLGCDLLLSVPLLMEDNAEVGAKRRAAIMLPRRKDVRGSYLYVPDVAHFGEDTEYRDDTNGKIPTRKDAWKDALTPKRHNDDESPPSQLESFEELSEEDVPPDSEGRLLESIGDAAAGRLLRTPKQVTGGKISSLAAAKESSTGTPTETLTTPSSQMHHRMSRMDAWRETISPRTYGETSSRDRSETL
jgi:hypothetical protein